MSVADVSREELDEILRRHLDPATHEAYMTTAEMIHKEGYEQGLEQARRMLLTLLEQRFGPLPDTVETRVRTAGADELDAWSRSVLRAASLDDVFAA